MHGLYQQASKQASKSCYRYTSMYTYMCGWQQSKATHQHERRQSRKNIQRDGDDTTSGRRTNHLINQSVSQSLSRLVIQQIYTISPRDTYIRLACYYESLNMCVCARVLSVSSSIANHHTRHQPTNQPTHTCIPDLREDIECITQARST